MPELGIVAHRIIRSEVDRASIITLGVCIYTFQEHLPMTRSVSLPLIKVNYLSTDIYLNPGIPVKNNGFR